MKLHQYALALAVGFVAPLVFMFEMLVVEPSRSQTPRETLHPKTYDQIINSDTETQRRLQEIALQHASMLTKMAALEQHLTDIDKRLDIHRTQIDADAAGTVSETERITRMEEYVKAAQKASDSAAAEARATHEANVAWARGISGGLFTAILMGVANEVWKRRSNRVFRAATGQRLNDIVESTNGMAEKLSDVRAESERAKGVIEGRNIERTDPGAV